MRCATCKNKMNLVSETIVSSEGSVVYQFECKTCESNKLKQGSAKK